MSELMTRRETIRMGLAGSLVALVPEWAYPALAQGESRRAVYRYPGHVQSEQPADGSRALLDLRKIDGLITPADQFFFIQHYDKPQIDPATSLKLTGLVEKPADSRLPTCGRCRRGGR